MNRIYRMGPMENFTLIQFPRPWTMYSRRKAGTANLPIGLKRLPPEAGLFTDANREIGGPGVTVP